MGPKPDGPSLSYSPNAMSKGPGLSVSPFFTFAVVDMLACGITELDPGR
jgi:hypothetical protein